MCSVHDDLSFTTCSVDSCLSVAHFSFSHDDSQEALVLPIRFPHRCLQRSVFCSFCDFLFSLSLLWVVSGVSAVIESFSIFASLFKTAIAPRHVKSYVFGRPWVSSPGFGRIRVLSNFDFGRSRSYWRQFPVGWNSTICRGPLILKMLGQTSKQGDSITKDNWSRKHIEGQRNEDLDHRWP